MDFAEDYDIITSDYVCNVLLKKLELYCYNCEPKYLQGQKSYIMRWTTYLRLHGPMAWPYQKAQF